MSRGVIVWLVTVPLAVAATQLAHALAYRLVMPGDLERAGELTATGHGYLTYVPLALAVGAVLVLLALLGEIRQCVAAPHRCPAGPHAWTFAALAPAIFAFQEHFERLAYQGGMPWETALAPTFVVGMLLQLPFALAAYALARFLLRAARSIGVLLVRPPRPDAAPSVPWPTPWLAAPRFPTLALGYSSRGPPAPLR
jgi:hypothetical protein